LTGKAGVGKEYSEQQIKSLTRFGEFFNFGFESFNKHNHPPGCLFAVQNSFGNIWQAVATYEETKNTILQSQVFLKRSPGCC